MVDQCQEDYFNCCFMLLRTQIFALLNVPPVAAVLVAVRKDGDNFRAKINHRLVLIDP